MAVAKHVAALRASGYTIEASPGSGYALTAGPDRLLAVEVAARVHSDLWTRFEGGGPTDSTMEDARSLARAGAVEGTVVLSSEQRQGRGRMGRTWSSPEGGVYLSMLLRPAMAPAGVAALSPSVALGVAQGLGSLGVHALVKWPNDVVLEDGKVAGVLLEMVAEADRIAYVIAGVGLNVARGSEPFQGAAYLEDALGQGLDPNAVAAAVLDGVADAYEVFTSRGFAALREGFSARSVLKGADVQVKDAMGSIVVSGTVSGVDDGSQTHPRVCDAPCEWALVHIHSNHMLYSVRVRADWMGYTAYGIYV